MSDSICLWETNGRTAKRASEVDRTRLFHSVSVGSDVLLERPVRGRPDITSDEVKKHLY